MNGNNMEERYKVTIEQPNGIEIVAYMDEGEPAKVWVELFVKMTEAMTFARECIFAAMQRVLEDEGIIDKQTKDDGKR